MRLKLKERCGSEWDSDLPGRANRRRLQQAHQTAFKLMIGRHHPGGRNTTGEHFPLLARGGQTT